VSCAMIAASEALGRYAPPVARGAKPTKPTKPKAKRTAKPKTTATPTPVTPSVDLESMRQLVARDVTATGGASATDWLRAVLHGLPGVGVAAWEHPGQRNEVVERVRLVLSELVGATQYPELMPRLHAAVLESKRASIRDAEQLHPATTAARGRPRKARPVVDDLFRNLAEMRDVSDSHRFDPGNREDLETLAYTMARVLLAGATELGLPVIKLSDLAARILAKLEAQVQNGDGLRSGAAIARWALIAAGVDADVAWEWAESADSARRTIAEAEEADDKARRDLVALALGTAEKAPDKSPIARIRKR